MATQFTLDNPGWADDYVWNEAVEFANKWSDNPDATNIQPVVAPGIRLAWKKLTPEERFVMLVHWRAAQNTKGSQFGQGGLGSVVVPIGEAVFNLVGSGSISGAAGNQVLGDLGHVIGGGLAQSGAAIADITGSINSVLKQVGNASTTIHQNFTSDMTRSLSQILGEAGTVVTGIGTSVSNAAGGVFNTVSDTIDRAISALYQSVQSALGTAVKTITSSVTAVTDKVGAALQSSVGALTSSLGTIIDKVRDIVGSVSNALAGAVNAIESAVTGVVNSISETVMGTIGAVKDFVGGVIDDVKSVAAAAAKTVADEAQAVVNGAKEIYDSVSAGVGDAIKALTDAASGALTVANEVLHSLEGSISALVPTLESAVKEAYTFVTDDLPTRVRDKIADELTSLTNATSSLLKDVVTQILLSFGMPIKPAEQLATKLSAAFENNPVLATIVGLVLPIYLAAQVVQVPGQMIAQRIGQEMAIDYPITLETASDIQEELRQGLVTLGIADDTLRRQGFSEEAAQRLIAARRRIAEVGVIQTWFLRDFITEDTARTQLGQLGFNEADADAYLKMAFFIPPVQDLITMAVREVFSPAIAEKFGQFQDFPQDFANHAKQQGVSEEWAKNYWAAHWALPSLTMGYEMLHRRVISREDLDVLLRAQDVMPYWRDKLVQISYDPLTRVDVRRMHKLGVLSDGDLLDKYQDIGYSPDNARLLQDFTIGLNKPHKSGIAAELDKLSRSTILQLFSEGTIPKAVASVLLTEAGVGNVAAGLYIEHQELIDHMKARNAQRDLIIEQAAVGVKTFHEAEDALATLGLTGTELAKARTQLEHKRAAQTQTPSRADLDKFLKADLIDANEYTTAMQLNGYSAFWTERYLALAQKG